MTNDPHAVSVRVSIVDVVVARWHTTGLQIWLARRASGTRCTGAWELVHGRIEPGERPEEAAVREVREECGLATDRLYNITLGGFYLHHLGTVALSVVFCAIVAADVTPVLGAEHDEGHWCSVDEAMRDCAWPREREALQHVAHLLRNGRDAGAVNDVLGVPPERWR
jgi:dihydroneopterin triphosphate diphosphatase